MTNDKVYKMSLDKLVDELARGKSMQKILKEI